MSNILKFIAIALLGIEVFIGIPILVSQSNPCSVWATNQQECNSNATQDLGK